MGVGDEDTDAAGGARGRVKRGRDEDRDDSEDQDVGGKANKRPTKEARGSKGSKVGDRERPREEKKKEEEARQPRRR